MWSLYTRMWRLCTLDVELVHQNVELMQRPAAGARVSVNVDGLFRSGRVSATVTNTLF